MPPGILVRPWTDADWPALHALLREAAEGGDAFAVAPGATEQELRDYWQPPGARGFVATTDEGVVVGTYYLKANQPGLGAHVANAGYLVARAHSGRGIAGALCEHSQATARALGFRAMQFNLVVSTNERAVRLWRKHGFAIIGVTPGGFRHARLGFVDAYVMFKALLA